MAEDFEEFVQGQFPFRPDHPDWQRLREVVDRVEGWKAAGKTPEETYAELMDTYSVAYLATNRSGMNQPTKPLTQAGIVDLMANSWVEGFLYGVLFQQLGGHREE